jgi:phosphonate utilization transcriptional regulator
MSSPTIAQLQSSSLTQVVQQEIESAILAGDYPPGSKLNEAALALSLGVSRGPVREAFRSLEEAGLLRTEKNRGVFVRAIPLNEAAEIFDIRAVMEELAGRLLAQSLQPAQLAELKTTVAQMDQAVAGQDLDTYHLLNGQFHERLLDMSGNKKLLSLYKKLTRELALFRRINLTGGDALPASVSDHHHIVEAIATGQPDVAAKALFEHVRQSKERTLARHATPNSSTHASRQIHASHP